MQHEGELGSDENLETMMSRMADGHSDALFALLARYRDELVKSVRWILRDLGRADVGFVEADLDYLVHTAALVVFDRARGWRPGAAKPWVWAHRSIRAEIVTWLGHPRVEFDAQMHERTAPGSTIVPEIDLSSLAQRDERIADWLGQVDEVANDRDRQVHLEYQIQKHLGDRSPAHTVAAMFDLSPSNVRQIDARVRRRVRDLVDEVA